MATLLELLYVGFIVVGIVVAVALILLALQLRPPIQKAIAHLVAVLLNLAKKLGRLSLLIINTFARLVVSIERLFTGILNKVANAFAGVADFVSATLTRAVKAIDREVFPFVSKVSSLATKAYLFIQSFVGAIQNAASNVLGDLIRKIILGFISLISTAIKNIILGIQIAINAVESIITAAISGVTTAINVLLPPATVAINALTTAVNASSAILIPFKVTLDQIKSLLNIIT